MSRLIGRVGWHPAEAGAASLTGAWLTAEVVRIPGTDHFSVRGEPRLPQAIPRFPDAETSHLPR